MEDKDIIRIFVEYHTPKPSFFLPLFMGWFLVTVLSFIFIQQYAIVLGIILLPIVGLIIAFKMNKLVAKMKIEQPEVYKYAYGDKEPSFLNSISTPDSIRKLGSISNISGAVKDINSENFPFKKD